MSSANDTADIVADLLSPLALLLNNPWQKNQLAHLDVEMTVTHQNNLCSVESAQLSQRIFRPGQTIQARVTLQPVRSSPVTTEIKLQLPDDLPDGRYTIKIGSVAQYRRELQTAQPQRYVAFDMDDVRRIMQQRLALRRDRLYLSLVLPEQGVAIGQEELPGLPASKTAILTDPSRRNATTPFRKIISSSVPTDYVVLGDKSFEIEVRRR